MGDVVSTPHDDRTMYGQPPYLPPRDSADFPMSGPFPRPAGSVGGVHPDSSYSTKGSEFWEPVRPKNHERPVDHERASSLRRSGSDRYAPGPPTSLFESDRYSLPSPRRSISQGRTYGAPRSSSRRRQPQERDSCVSFDSLSPFADRVGRDTQRDRRWLDLGGSAPNLRLDIGDDWDRYNRSDYSRGSPLVDWPPSDPWSRPPATETLWRQQPETDNWPGPTTDHWPGPASDHWPGPPATSWNWEAHNKARENECSHRGWNDVAHPLDSRGMRNAHDTLIIWDWDDTIMCSTAINTNRVVQHQIPHLDQVAEQLLQLSNQLGESVIVTNADELWVETSARQFAPRVLPILQRMRVLSARRKYEHMSPGDAFMWKRETFRDVLSSRRRTGMSGGVNLIVLGDSLAEMEASQTATVGISPLFVKTVKFREVPTVEELISQLRTLLHDLPAIVADDRSYGRTASTSHGMV